MTEGIKFSILTTAYNVSELFDVYLNSVLSQTYENYELLILENGSTDNTRELLMNIKEKDSRIRVVCVDDNIGWPHGTSELMKYATGDYMMMLAADDFLADKDALKKVAEVINKNTPDVVMIGTYASYYDKEKKMIIVEPEESNSEIEYYENDNRLSTIWNIMSTTYYNAMFHFEKIDFLRKNNIDFYHPYYGDCASMTEALCKAKNIAVIHERLHSLTYNTSKSASMIMLALPMLTQWQSIKDMIIKEGVFDLVTVVGISVRIMYNLYSCLADICSGARLMDDDFNVVEANDLERLEIIENVINDKNFREMDLLVDYYNKIDNEEKFYYELNQLYERLNVASSKRYSRKDRLKQGIEIIKMLMDIAYDMKSINMKSEYLLVSYEAKNIFDEYEKHYNLEEIEYILKQFKKIV